MFIYWCGYIYISIYLYIYIYINVLSSKIIRRFFANICVIIHYIEYFVYTYNHLPLYHIAVTCIINISIYNNVTIIALP